MKNTFLIILISTIISFLNFCSTKNEKKFTIPENYKLWNMPAGKVLDYPIPGHGSGVRVIYANSAAYNVSAVKDGDIKGYKFSEGAVIIKEIYETKEAIGITEPVLTIMVKDSKHAKSINGWLYLMKPPKKEAMIVESRMCYGCHESANERHIYFDKNEKDEFRDFIFVPFNK